MRLTRALMTSLLVVGSLACSSTTKPKALPPQTMAPTPPETKEPITNAEESLEPETRFEPLATGIEVVEETPTEPAQPVTTTEDGITVVLDPGDEEADQPQSLFSASQAEKERREEAGESTIVLTNKNLKDYSKGQLTFVEGDDAEGAADDTEGQEEDASETGADEAFWRDRVLGIRMDWRESLDLIEELESEVASLRRDFYAEDDPFYRDSQIKPAWDQALENLEQTKRDAEQAQQDLDVAMEEGRRAGALPGWLREGVELEPTEEELEELLPQEGEEGIHEPSEPVILDEDDGGGR